MPEILVGVFSDYNAAHAAVEEIVSSGVPREDISVIAADRTGVEAGSSEPGSTAGAAGTGAAVGGTAGLIAGLAALAIPGIGPVVAAGPIVAALTGAGVGAAAGGVIGAMTHMGISEDQARAYSDAVREGRTVVTVRAGGQNAIEVENILRRGQALRSESESRESQRANAWRPDDPHSQADTFGEEGGASEWGRSAALRETNLATARGKVEVYDPEMSVAPDLADPAIRQTWDHYSSRYSWEDFSAAWRLGHTFGTSPRYGSADWKDVEADARMGWEAERGNTWERFQEIVRHAWEHVRGRSK